VNRLTVRQAITDLVNEGLLRRQRGIGTFVAPQKITQTMPGLVGFTERMLRAGRQPYTKVLSIGIEPPPHSAVKALQLSAAVETVKLVRLRSVDDAPFMIETSYLPLRLVPDLMEQDLENNSLYRLLSSRYHLQMAEATEVLEPVLLTAYEAELLGSEAGRPALLVEGTIYGADNQPIEFTKSLVRGDKARFLFTLHRTGDSAR
jgi:GntR family transcriptional regulator